jgi:conjugative transfer signal peptidase TraF
MPLKIHSAAPFYAMGIAFLVVSLSVNLWKRFGPTFLINGTPSEPVGFYRLVPRPESAYRRGMYVVFPVPAELRDLVYGRHWMRNGIPFLKEVLGLEGDRVCIFADRVEINDRLIGPVFRVDSSGLPLPQRRGCLVIPAGYFLAASQHFAKSFDGRYFGPLPLSILMGEARPLWIF